MCGPCFLIGTASTALDFDPMKLDALKRLQAETPVNHTGQAAAELNALLPAILPSAPSYDGTGDRAFKGEL